MSICFDDILAQLPDSVLTAFYSLDPEVRDQIVGDLIEPVRQELEKKMVLNLSEVLGDVCNTVGVVDRIEEEHRLGDDKGSNDWCGYCQEKIGGAGFYILDLHKQFCSLECVQSFIVNQLNPFKDG